MSTSEKRAKNSAAARDGRRGLHGAVDEIVESVLDAADLDILEDLGDQQGERALGPELLRELMLDIMARYDARRRRSLALAGGEEGS